MSEELKTYPVALPVKQLLLCHPEYSPAQMCRHGDLYAGGQAFESRKHLYLRTKAIENNGPSGQAYRRARLDCAAYTPHVSGVIDNLTGAALQAPPTIDVVDHNDERAKYWTDLVTNCDGRGRDLRSTACTRLRQLMVHKRAYWLLERPSLNEGNDLAAVKKSGSLDVRIRELNACDVDDWECDDDGNLLWVRIHAVECTRHGISPMDQERHTWTFIDSTHIVEYEATRKAKAKTWEKDATARRLEPRKHGIGALPVIRIEVDDGFWVMDRLESTILAFFNREASREFALDMGALNLPIIKTEKDVASIVMSEMAALKLNPVDSFEFASPNTQVYQALKEDCEYLLGNMYSAIHAMALRAASQQENARQSGVAKYRDQGPMEVLLSLFAAPLKDALEKSVRIIAKLRNEEALKPAVKGLDRFDVQSTENELNKTKSFVDISGQFEPAKRYALAELFTKVFPGAPSEVKAEVGRAAKEQQPQPSAFIDVVGKLPLALQQLALARQRFIETGDTARAEKVGRKMDELLAGLALDDAPAAPSVPAPNTAIRNVKTQEPQGFGKAQTQMSYTR